MSGTHSPVLVRMKTELKEQLQAAATRSGKTLTGEINSRLQESIYASDQSPVVLQAQLSHRLPKSYTDPHAATMVHAKCNGPDYVLTDIDQAMLDVFHALPVEKQLALLSLFR